MPDIVISEFMDEAAVAHLAAQTETVYDPKLVDDPARLAVLVTDARALIVRNRTQVRGAMLDAGARLECVGRLGVGLDNIDVGACRARGVAVFPATGANDASVAEWVMGAALTLIRGAFAATAEVAAGGWPRERLIGGELGGRTVGLLGFGGTARAVARRAAAFDAAIIAHDPHLAPEDPRWAGAERVAGLPELLARADVLSLHVPLTDATRNLIDSAALGAMKPGAILINAARGGVVDEVVLATALREGRLGGAALDVFAVEPLTAAAGAVFTGVPNLILSPHVAGVTAESNVRVSTLIADRVSAHLGLGR